MATDLGQPRSPATKHDAFARAQLAKAEARIRALDLAAALFGFLAGTCAFAVLMVLCDKRWELSATARQGAFLLYLLGAAVYLAYTVVRPLRRRVNPLYAAMRMEETLDGAKNSVINWVDLRRSELPPAITAAVGQRAARDLARADLEQAISGKRAGWSGGLAGIMFVLFVTLFIMFGPRQFLSLFRRSFVPFTFAGISKQTILTVVRPENGDATLPIGRSVTIGVQVTGRVPNPKNPDALRLLYRYQESDPFIERPLQHESADEWAISINANDVQNGFWYKVAGGDDETPEYRITVRATPLLTDFRAVYHFRVYTGRPDELRKDRKLEAVRGTEVALRVRTNRAVKEAFIDLDAGATKKALRADRLENDAEGFQARFVLEESGQYRIRYTSTEGETYFDPTSFPIVAQPDKPPVVKLTKPGQDISLPANGVLQLEGDATDDFGVKSMVLRLQMADGQKLNSQPYRSEKALKLPGGGHPLMVEYKDFVDLSKLPGPGGRPLAVGDVLEYWLEATDACDYPQPNVFASKHFRVKLTEPVKDPMQQQKEKEKAEQQKKEHEAKQDQDNKKEDKARQEEAKRRDEEIKNQDEPKNGGQEPGSNGQQGNKPEKNEGNKDGKDPADQGQKGNNGKPEQDPKKEELNNTKERLEKELAKNEPNKDQQPGADQGQKNGNDKDGKNQQNDGQKGGDNQPKDQPGQGDKKNDGKGDAKADPKQEPGKEKGAGQQEQKPDKGDAKDDGKKQGGEKPADEKNGGAKGDKDGQGQPKDRGSAKSGDDKNGMGKGGDSKPQAGKEPGQAKNDGKNEPSPKPGEGKPGDNKGGQPDGGQKPAAEKPAGNNPMQGGKSDGKPGGDKGQTADGKPTGDAKEKPGEPNKGASKDGGERAGANERKAEPRDGGMKPDGAQPGEDKNAPKDGKRETIAKSQPKGDRKPMGDPEERRTELPDDEKLARLLRDLKSKDPQTRQKARDELEKMTDEQFDDLRQAQKDALEGKKPDAGRRKRERDERDDASGKNIAKSKPSPDKDGKGKDGEPCADCKNNGPAKDGAGQSKPGQQGEGAKGQADAKDRGEQGKGGNQPGNEGQPADGEATAKGKGKTEDGTRNGSGVPEAGGKANARVGEGQPDGNADAQPEPARFQDRSGVLQLEEFKRKIDKKILKDANISEEDYRAFLKAYEEMLKRPQAQARGNETLPAPKTGSTLPSVGARQVKPTGTATDVKAGARPQPPPRYRDAYREFTRQLASPDARDGK